VGDTDRTRADRQDPGEESSQGNFQNPQSLLEYGKDTHDGRGGGLRTPGPTLPLPTSPHERHAMNDVVLVSPTRRLSRLEPVSQSVRPPRYTKPGARQASAIAPLPQRIKDTDAEDDTRVHEPPARR